MKKVVTIGDKSYSLSFDEFDEEMDIDDLLKIDYSNLVGEIITFPVIVNRFGQMLAEAENAVSERKLNVEIFEAKLKEKYRVELSNLNGGKQPTIEALNNAMLIDKSYLVMKKSLFTVQKTRDYIASCFWSAKDKSAKLDKLSLTMSSNKDVIEEAMLNAVEMNGVGIKKIQGYIK